MELEKPVIGTEDPAPANRPISSNTLSPVKMAAMATKDMDVAVAAFSSEKPKCIATSPISWPKQQIKPPTIKAFNISNGKLDFLDFRST